MIRKFSVSNLLEEQAKITVSTSSQRHSESPSNTASSGLEQTTHNRSDPEARDSPEGGELNFEPLPRPRPCSKPWFADRTYRRHSAGEVIVKKSARRRYDRAYSLTESLFRDSLERNRVSSLPRRLSKPLLQIIDPHTYENIYSMPSMDSLDGK